MAKKDETKEITESTSMQRDIDNTTDPSPNREQKIPENPWQAAIQIIWKWKSWWRNLSLLTAGAIFVSYLVWSTLPEKVKTELLTGRRYESRESSDTKSPANSSRDVIREKSAAEL